ncbi:DEAD/DEAH box helicase [Naumannella halotolerans]|uniref:DEAD/DEAH box helicase n=1 Tax=Naumannella halotolerans TaxID=993414 RepID=UPI001FB90619|nr:DEAD/DEAH box helicase [Naumannella halotolerans]
MANADRLPPAFPDRAAWGTVKQLRAWQQAALNRYREDEPKDFLAVATPGAGKTSFALTVAAELLNRRIVNRVIVVAPTEHLKTQWAQAAARVGIQIDPNFGTRQGPSSADFQGYALTYAGVAANPLALRIRTEQNNTLVILDEIHHAGDARSWGEAVREAFEPARRRLALTGTPFRSDANPIPFVRYEPDGTGALRSRADYSYGYGPALSDGIVRPVLFMAYGGDMQWRTKAGEELAARLGGPLTKDLTAQALRTALDPGGAWIPAVLRAANTRLTEVRSGVPDAGGLVIANDQSHARAYAKILQQITGEPPTLVLSDEPGSSKRITEFAESEDRWMVAVRMVSEGVDVPRLAVGVYATATLTPLFFAQAVGRFVRARSRGETASVFLPSIAPLLSLAAGLETERDHALKPKTPEDEAALLAEAQQEKSEPDLVEGTFTALASEADFEKVVFDGGEFGLQTMSGSDEERDYLGLPGLLEPDQVKDLLRRRQAAQVERSESARAQSAAGAPERPRAAHEDLRELRKQLNTLVAAWHHRSGKPHGVIHNELREACGGPAAVAATGEQLTERIERIRSWATRG